MKKLLGIVVLCLLLTNLSQADDIKEFQIAGLSIGDSLLNHMSAKQIKSSKLNYFKDERKYYVVNLETNNSIYDTVEVYLKTNDNNYEIKAIGGFFMNLKKNCLEKKEEIAKELDSVFLNTKPVSDIKSHETDKTGKSKQHLTQYSLGGRNHIRVECVFWSNEIKKKKGWKDNLIVVAMSDEISHWVTSGYK
tara:strand:- start:7748 stop:8323 length:576 start_codon:yes stop_codon:yes gene_type:complete